MPDPMPDTALARHHEVADVDARRIVFAAAGLAVVIVVVVLAALGAYALLGRGHARARTADVTQSFQEPRLQSQPAASLRALRDEKEALLHEYRWLDADRGVVRIPIEQAMQVLAERARTGARRDDASPEPAR